MTKIRVEVSGVECFGDKKTLVVELALSPFFSREELAREVRRAVEMRGCTLTKDWRVTFLAEYNGKEWKTLR
ncbi:MAG: hypothetical protein GXO39_05060 [Thermotogae bacterium]|nr:hypothetical protein [Thermotogota bacterium]